MKGHKAPVTRFNRILNPFFFPSSPRQIRVLAGEISIPLSSQDFVFANSFALAGNRAEKSAIRRAATIYNYWSNERRDAKRKMRRRRTVLEIVVASIVIVSSFEL